MVKRKKPSACVPPSPGPKEGDDGQAQNQGQLAADHGAGAGDHGHQIAHLGIGAEGRDHRPEGDVHHGVGHAPENIEDGTVGHHPGGTQKLGGIKEQQEHHDGIEHGADQDPGTELAPAALGIVHNPPHDRVIEGIPDAGDQEYHADEGRRQLDHVGEVHHQITCHDPVGHILAYGADAEGCFFLQRNFRTHVRNPLTVND